MEEHILYQNIKIEQNYLELEESGLFVNIESSCFSKI